MAAPRRKFTIRPIRPSAEVRDRAWALKTWGFLEGALEKIFSMNASQLSYEELYRTAYHLVLHKFGKVLYEGVRDVIRRNLRDQVPKAVEADDVISGVLEIWDRHRHIMQNVSDVLYYMDHNYAAKHALPTSYEVGLSEMYTAVVRHGRVRSRLQREILDRVLASRRGEPVDKDPLRRVLAMLCALGGKSRVVYETEFEQAFLEETETFYAAESAEFVSGPVDAYLAKAHTRLREETERVREYLTDGTAMRLSEVMERVWIVGPAAPLLEEEGAFRALVTDGRVDQLRLMYRLFKAVRKPQPWAPPRTASGGAGGGAAGGAVARGEARSATPVQMMRDVFHHHITEAGRRLVEDPATAKEPVRFVGKLLELRAHYSRLVEGPFGGDTKFFRSIKDAFEWFVNLDTRTAQSLALYLDSEFRVGFRGATPEAVESSLSAVLQAFRFLRDKDVFENYYKGHLQRRLLQHKSVSHEAERAMIAKLKAECGNQYTSKMEGMFADLAISREQWSAFCAEEGGGRNPVKPLEVTVLTTVHWPPNPLGHCVFPPAMASLADRFRAWYLKTNSGRKLDYYFSLGSADVRLLYTDKRYELTISSYQLALLLQFEDVALEDAISLRELADRTRIEPEELKRHLISLTTPRARVLLRSKPKTDGDLSCL